MPKPFKVPLRKCVVTQEQHPKKDLIRIVKNKVNDVFIDTTGKMNGRGAYLKKEVAIVNKAKKSKKLERHLGTTIPDSIYEELIQLIKDES